MKIRYLLSKYITNINSIIPDINILGIETNSNYIKYGYAFFSISCTKNKHSIINQSISKGAFIIIQETKIENFHGISFYIKNIPLLLFFNLKEKLSEIASIYYNNPSSGLKIIGITGTNGKTTTSFFISQILKHLGIDSYLITTLGNGRLDNFKHTGYTTDLAFDIQKSFYKSKKLNINIIIIEISSHSLEQFRINNIKFEFSIFTNISHDHLDFHKNIYNYAKSKLSFFTKYKSLYNIVNYNDKLGKKIISIFSDKTFLVSYKINNYKYLCKNSINIYKIIYYNNITKVYIKYNNIKYFFITKIYEYFNIINLVLSISAILLLKYPIDLILKITSLLKLPIGRMNIIYNNNLPLIVDYAHTPDSVLKIIKCIKTRYYKYNIIILFGCGGNRDKNKRSYISNIIFKYSKFVIITSDNPRNERFINIVNDILLNIKNNINYIIIFNREKAIRYALNKFNKDNNLILFLGKGHENFQEFYKKKNYHSDIFTIINYIKNND